MKLTIKNIYGDIMFEVEADSFIKAVEQRCANLRGANLRGANLRGANLCGADLRGANLCGANLRGADLYGANLRGANLRGANLCGADLCGADLYGADLRGADLYGANLCGAKNISKYITTSLYFLLDQPGKIRAYKLINAQGEGPYNGGINYLDGKKFTAQANMDESEQCGAGINLATLDWCMKEWHKGYRIIVMEFTAKRKDGTPNICIPMGSDGKFRVCECKRVGEKDLKELGLEV